MSRTLTLGGLLLAGVVAATATWFFTFRTSEAPPAAPTAAAAPGITTSEAPVVAPPPPEPEQLTTTTVALETPSGPIEASITPAAELDETAKDVTVTLKTASTTPMTVEVIWRRVASELGAPPRIMARETVRIRPGNDASSRFQAGREGLLPGEYEVAMAVEGAERTIPFRVRGAHPPAGLVVATEGVPGLNVALAALGGRIVSASVALRSENWRPDNLIDGFPFQMGGGGGCVVCGWTTQDATFPQEVVFALAQEREFSIDAVVVDPSTEDTSGGDWARIPRNVEVWVSRTSGSDGFTQVASARVAPRAAEQLLTFSATPAKFVKLRVLSNWGGNTTQIGEVRVLEAAGTSALADVARNIARPELGGVIARYTSQSGVFEGVQYLIDGKIDRAWQSNNGYLPQDFVFAFKDDQVALVDRVVLNPTTHERPENFPKTVLVSTSQTDLFHFDDVGTFSLPKEAIDHVLRVGRDARFLRIRVLDNHGGARTSLNEIQIIEGSRPGYTSVLARAERSPATGARTAPSVNSQHTAATEREPNDQIEQANDLPAGSAMSGAIQPIAERDHFALDLPSGGRQVLTLKVTGTPYVRTSIALLDHNGHATHRFDPSAVAASSTNVSWLVAGGRGVLQVTEPPPSIVLIWDTSTSMLGRTDQLKEAVHAYLSQVKPTEQLNLIRFSADVDVLLPDFTSDVATLMNATQGKFQANGGTRLYDALARGVDLLSKRSGNRAIVLMSDGEDSASRLEAPEFWKVLQDHRIRVYTIGLGVALKGYAPSLASTGQRFLGHVSLATNGRTFLARSTDELKGLYDRIASELRETAQYTLTPRVSAATGTLHLTATGERIPSVSAPSRIELVLDASGSMRRRLGNRTMMDAAKDVLSTVITNLPEDVEVGMRVYGHRVREGQRNACQDTELVQPLAPLNRTRLLERIKSIQALGTTPIAYTLSQVAKDLARVDGEKMVILVTDGKEECGGDLKAAITALDAQGLKVKVNVVGFALSDASTRQQMQDLAALTRGAYFDARDDVALKSAMEQAMAVSFSVQDSAGVEMASGRVGGEPVDLPEGHYSVVVQSADREMRIADVPIVAARQTAIELKKEGREVGIKVNQP